MVIGVNLPDAEHPLSDSHWARIRALRPGQFTITSRVHLETLERLSSELPHALIHVRSLTVTPIRSESEGVLDYRPTSHSRTLGECLEALRRRVPAKRLFWVGGSELSKNQP